MNIAILAGLLVATLVSQSSGAAMIPEHPQTAFCKADFGEASFDNVYSVYRTPLCGYHLDVGVCV